MLPLPHSYRRVFQILNIGDVSSWMSQEEREDEDGFLTRSILSMPIVNGQKTVIGVAQLINKVCPLSGGMFESTTNNPCLLERGLGHPRHNNSSCLQGMASLC
uniref:GAF domain-containing protein n=1 Tax=Timema poppense TaxID=170557 RepID=A0A7R9D2Y2_TIMPO|nr:unnamed protein product [Timema poppensis]